MKYFDIIPPKKTKRKMLTAKRREFVLNRAMYPAKLRRQYVTKIGSKA